MAKTKERVVEIRTRILVTPVSILGVCVETVEEYKCPSFHTENTLDFIKNTEALYKNGQSQSLVSEVAESL